ncbi:hypothetical protein PMAYCL1PPCAC_14079, partial [Pristionchus mayeri]
MVREETIKLFTHPVRSFCCTRARAASRSCARSWSEPARRRLLIAHNYRTQRITKCFLSTTRDYLPHLIRVGVKCGQSLLRLRLPLLIA